MAKRILIVDDDPDLREATSIILRGAGPAAADVLKAKVAELLK
jgi:CheY-like chemotaxis protein